MCGDLMPRPKSGKKVEYTILKIPVELAEEINDIIGKHGYRSRAEFAKEAIRTLLREYAILGSYGSRRRARTPSETHSQAQDEPQQAD